MADDQQQLLAVLAEIRDLSRQQFDLLHEDHQLRIKMVKDAGPAGGSRTTRILFWSSVAFAWVVGIVVIQTALVLQGPASPRPQKTGPFGINYSEETLRKFESIRQEAYRRANEDPSAAPESLDR